jgi:hypothetical protein
MELLIDRGGASEGELSWGPLARAVAVGEPRRSRGGALPCDGDVALLYRWRTLDAELGVENRRAHKAYARTSRPASIRDDRGCDQLSRRGLRSAAVALVSG